MIFVLDVICYVRLSVVLFFGVFPFVIVLLILALLMIMFAVLLLGPVIQL